MSYITSRAVGTLTTATGNIVIGLIDISLFDKFSVSYLNLASAALLECQVEVAVGPHGNSANTLTYVIANSSTIPSPSALGASAGAVTSAVDNCFRWLRIKAHTTSTALAANLQLAVTIGGFARST